jgi:hypothetical protein
MKFKNLLLLFSIIGLHLIANAQENLVGKGTKMIMGLGSFSSLRTNYSSDNINTLSLSGSYDRFYKDNMFIGVNLSSFYQNAYNFYDGALALGPEIGYVFGNQNSKIFPLIVGGCGFEVSDPGTAVYNAGLNLSIGVGVIIPIQKNLGLIIQGKYDNLKFLGSDSKTNTISLNFGFLGLLF